MPVSRNLSFSDQRDPLFFHPSARTLTLGRVAPFAYIPSDPSRVYQNPAMKLIFLCRYFGQIHERNIYSSIEFRKVLIAADDALQSAVEARNRTPEVDKKFEEAIGLLSRFKKSFPSKDPTSGPNIDGSYGTVTKEAKMSDKSRSASTILYALENNLHANLMDNENPPEPTRIVAFHLLNSLPDNDPIVVIQTLSRRPSIQEILWDFSYSEDMKKRLTLKDNPHFYVDLPTSPEAYGDHVQIDPTEDFRHANKFYVLIDRPELVYIKTGRVSQFFGNFWSSQNAIIFKDISGRLKGESIVKVSHGGALCGFCERLPMFTVLRASGNHRGLQPIITEGCSSMGWKCSFGCLPMHNTVIDGLRILRICTGRVTPDSQLLVPLPPTSEQPGYSVAYRTHIHVLDNDSLLQIFNHYRQNDEENWHLRLTWRKLTHVCQRWRCLIYDSSFHLDLSLLLTNNSPSMHTLSHLPPLPLAVDYSDRTRTISREDEDNIHFGLQQHGLVRRVILQAPSSSLQMWLEPMNKLFPRLGDLSLLSTTTEEMSLVLPKTIQAPQLRRLALHGISLPKGLPLLSSTIALSTLSLTHIGASCYFPPGHLVTQLQGLPHLEELSIGFAIPIPLPSRERELLPAPIPPVTLPTLRQLSFRGVDAYLENLVAQINMPLLERLNLTFFFALAFTLVNLTEFIHRSEGFGCLVARVIFNKDGPSIYLGPFEQRGIGNLLLVNCEPLDWQIDSAAQVCNAVGNVVSGVEELTLNLDVDGIPSDWENTLDNMVWHELLLPFVAVKKLHIGSSLTLKLSEALESVDGGLVLELLPELQELEVPLKIDHATNAFSMFMKTRESVGRPIHLLVPPEFAGPSLSEMSLSSKESVLELPQEILAAQAGPRPKLEAIVAERKEKTWQARAVGLVGRLRGKNNN